jgi:hypothetical protein
MEQDSGFDPATRRLCPDGTCIGVLGADGVCGECGRRFDASGANPVPAPLAAADGIDSSADAADAAGTEFDPSRRLCEDGTCVGVIGANGACTVCGRVAG